MSDGGHVLLPLFGAPVFNLCSSTLRVVSSVFFNLRCPLFFLFLGLFPVFGALGLVLPSLLLLLFSVSFLCFGWFTCITFGEAFLPLDKTMLSITAILPCDYSI
uniref:Transmembrane protein n=1 Tax=Populus davidiana TaxID=266767 RepID=A0A6M2EKD9_9ROSI